MNPNSRTKKQHEPNYKLVILTETEGILKSKTVEICTTDTDDIHDAIGEFIKSLVVNQVDFTQITISKH